MVKNFDSFLETIKNERTRNVASLYSSLENYDYTNCDLYLVKEVVNSFNFDNRHRVNNFLSILRNYAKYMEYDKLRDILDKYDNKTFFDKELMDKKYITKEEFESLYNDLDSSFEINILLKQTLILCLFEGVYSKDFSVLTNLKRSDIHGNTLILNNDNGETYHIEVSDRLIRNLINLSEIDDDEYFEVKNRFSISLTKGVGKYSNSCFKFENRQNNSKFSYRDSFYKRYNKVIKKYLEKSVSPMDFVLSGILYRIISKCNELELDIVGFVNEKNDDPIIRNIIKEEFNRCNLIVRINTFRNYFVGHIDYLVN